MSFKIEDDSVLVKYNEIWNKIKKTLNMKFHSPPIYDEKYIKTKVKTFNDVINTAFFRQGNSKRMYSLHLYCSNKH